LLQQPVEAAISSILKAVGEAAAADRAWMFEYDDELLRFRNTHEWSRPGTPSFVEDLQEAPVAIIGWLQQFLAANKAVMINRVGALPAKAKTLRAELLRQDDKSVLCVPSRK
jgi:GAF domain-containing protein